MSPKEKIKATKLTVGLPFGLGQLEFQNDEVQQRAAWALYVELATRVAAHPLGPEEGILRESLTSLYNVFGITRQILREAGPSIARGPASLGFIAIEVLNKGLRPFLAKWHPLLKTYEENRPAGVTTYDYEVKWDQSKQLRTELEEVRLEMVVYMEALGQIAGIG